MSKNLNNSSTHVQSQESQLVEKILSMSHFYRADHMMDKYPGESNKEKIKDQKEILQKLGQVIYNFEGYDKGTNLNMKENAIKGKPVFASYTHNNKTANLPIGYHISIPNEEIKGVAVEVYGGNQVTDRVSRIEKTASGRFTTQKAALLDNGIINISLCLVNLKTLTVLQHFMSKTIHNFLHASIHHFYELFKNSPEQIHEALVQYKDLPIALYGASFGGGMAIQHAELYPDSFDNYIAVSGGLNYCNDSQTKFSGLTRGVFNKDYLDATKNLKSLAQPVLVLHNYDDHRLPIKVPVVFYKECQRLGKDHLVTIKFYPEGKQAAPLHEFDLRGHFLSKKESIYNDYAELIPNFVQGNYSKVNKEMATWRTYKYDNLTSRYLENSSTKEKLCSEAFVLFKKAQHSIKDLNEGQIWETQYKPLLNATYYLDELKQLGESYFVNRPDYNFEPQKILNKINPSAVNIEQLKKGLKLFIEQFVIERYVDLLEKDTPDAEMFISMDVNKLTNNQTLLDYYQDLICEPAVSTWWGSKDEVYKMIFPRKTLIKANPELAPEQKLPYGLKEKFIDMVRQEGNLIQNVWRKAITEVMAMNKEEKLKSDLEKTEIVIENDNGVLVIGAEELGLSTESTV